VARVIIGLRNLQDPREFFFILLKVFLFTILPFILGFFFDARWLWVTAALMTILMAAQFLLQDSREKEDSLMDRRYK
jgi:hypothetical protein